MQREYIKNEAWVKLLDFLKTKNFIEALRFHDIENLSQIDAVKKMGVSRSTFARILDSAYHKMACALVTVYPYWTIFATFTFENFKQFEIPSINKAFWKH